MEALIAAAKILIKARLACSGEPMPVYLKAAHAADYIEKQISDMLNSEEF